MADFPPNLEDGELWLPSCIIHEIATPKHNPNAAVLPFHPTTNFEIGFGSSGGNGITKSHSALAANYKLARAPTMPISTTVKGVAGNYKGKDSGVRYGGTGVFLPRTTVILTDDGDGDGDRRRFLNRPGSVTRQKKKQSNLLASVVCA